MALSSEEIKAAEKLHDFVREYEKRRRFSRWSLPLSLSLSFLSSLRLAVQTRPSESVDHAVGLVGIGITSGMVLMTLIAVAQQKAQYKNSCDVLRLLEREHGDEMPWIAHALEKSEIERHFAALKQIEQELANTRASR